MLPAHRQLIQAGGRRYEDCRSDREPEARVPDPRRGPRGGPHPVRRAVRRGSQAHLVVDLSEHAASLFDPSAAELSRLTAEVAAADIAIFASPTYKASYTGLLKAFLDRYGNNGLAGTIAVPVMTGGWAGHALAVEVHLRPVLVELGATVPARGLYVTEPELPSWTPRWPGGPPPRSR